MSLRNKRSHSSNMFSSRACLHRLHDTEELACRRGNAPGAQHKRADELRSEAIISQHTVVQRAVTTQLRHLAAVVRQCPECPVAAPRQHPLELPCPRSHSCRL